MKRIELILWTTAILGEILSLIPVPGGMALFVLSMVFVILFYFGCSTFILNNIKLSELFKKTSYRDIPQSHIFFALGCGPIISMMCMGIVFKMQRWPGGFMYLLLPLLPAFAAIIVCIIKLAQRRHTEFYIRTISRTGILVAICIILSNTSSLTFSKIRYRNHPAYIEVANKLSADPHNKELLRQENEEMDNIHNNH